MKTYRAPWGTALRVMSSIITVLLVSVALLLAWYAQGVESLVSVGLMAILLIAGLYTVREYELRGDVLLVRRLFWTTRLPLAGLQSVRFEPDVMNRSLRLFGNGGLYSFTGLFRNRPLGRYRAYVTDLHRTVVLRFPDRTIVISPSAPREFVAELRPAAAAA